MSDGFLTVSADRDRCCGAGNCAAVLPEVFEQGADGLVLVRNARHPSSAGPAIAEAVQLCPVQAIAILPG